MGNNYVKIEKFVCNICGNIHSRNAGILLDRKLKDIPDDLISGYRRCEKCENLFQDDYVALVVVNNVGDNTNSAMTQEEAERTGTIIHIKKNILSELFEMDKNVLGGDFDMMFISKDLSENIKKIIPNDSDNN